MGVLDDLPDTPVGTRRSPLDDLPDTFAVTTGPKQQNRFGGTMRAVAQGVSFGFVDEMKAATQATLRRIKGEEVDWQKAYSEELAKDRGQLAEFAETNPYLSIGGNIAGGLLLPGGAAGTARTLAQAAIRGGATGGVTGAASGFGSAEGGAGNRAVGAAIGGTVGAGLGAVAGPAAKAIGALPGLLPGSGARRQGQAILRNALEAEGLPPGELAKRIADANRAGVKGVTIGDVATEGPTRTLAESVIHHPSTMQGPYTGMLQKRQAGEMTIKGNVAGQLEATESDVRKAVGLSKQRAFATAQQLQADRKAKAGPLFDQARRFDPSQDPTIGMVWRDVVDSDAGQDALNVTRKLWKNRYPKQPFPLDDPRNLSAVPNMEVMQLFKEGLDDEVSKLYRAGQNQLAGSAKELRDRFRDALAQANPAYGQALKQYAGDKALEEALERGRKFLTTHPDEVEATVAKMTPGEAEQYRIGAVTALFDRRKTGPTVDYTGPILKDQDNWRRIMAITPDDQTRELLLTQMTARQRMAGLSARAANSATSRREAADELIKGGQGVGELPTTWLGLGKLFLERTIGNLPAKVTQTRRAEIGRALMAQDSAALQALQAIPTGPTIPELAPGMVAAPLGAAAGQAAGAIATPPDPRRRRDLLGGP